MYRALLRCEDTREAATVPPHVRQEEGAPRVTGAAPGRQETCPLLTRGHRDLAPADSLPPQPWGPLLGLLLKRYINTSTLSTGCVAGILVYFLNKSYARSACSGAFKPFKVVGSAKQLLLASVRKVDTASGHCHLVPGLPIRVTLLAWLALGCEVNM